MFKKILSLFTFLLIISAIAAPVYADQAVFGPEDLTIGNLYVHLSSHQFAMEDPSDGVLTIVKNTTDKEIWGGFCFLNGKYIGLSNFLKGTSTIFEEDVDLLSNNRITIFLTGTPGASIKVEIKKEGVTPPPEVTFTADPATIYVGQSSTLSWTSSNADTCVIEPGIGSVDLNGSTTVSPTVTTTYSITATGLGGTATANTTITIANSAPVANDQTVTLNEDETVSITLTASDANGDALTFEIVSNPSHGTLTGSAPNLTYTPSLNYDGSDSFTFKANDGSLDSNTATVTLSIQPVNDAPTAVDDIITTNEDTVIAIISVLANDSDPDGDTLTIDDFTQPVHGTAGSNGDGTLAYTPDLNYNGTDSFTYNVSDGNGGIDTATVNITVNPVNDAPVANDQTVTLNEDETVSITLTASDADGDVLTYQIASNPTNGALTGSAPNLTYTPAENYNGSDAFTFTVNDGTVDSTDATVTITVNPVNDPPVADAGPDQTALQGNVVTLNGSASSDIDGDPLTYNWSFISVPTGSTTTLSNPSIVNPTFTADLIGTYEVRLIVNDSTLNSAPDNIIINIVALPTVDILANPLTILTGESSTLSWTSTNADTCSIEPGIGSVALNGSNPVSPTETTTYTITATNAGGTATASITITVNVPPTVNFNATPATIAQGGSSVLSWTSDGAQSAHIDNGIGNVSVNGSITVNPEHTTTYTLSVTGGGGSASAKAIVKVTGNPAPQPEGSFGKRYEDLVPPDSTVDEYDPKRFSLITGIVHAIDDSPIQDVSITIHSHPGYGTVLTDTTGRFTIPVEGGGAMTVAYAKEGLITSHRQVYVPWNDIAIAETIQMIAQDPASTTFTFDGNPATMATHKSTEVTDEFGSRSCSMVFTGDNSAWLVDENGNDIHQLETITVRASEYTTEDSMPAILPPTSAYTYCVELSVDGAAQVRFEQPVIIWVDNFLGFEVGIPAPVGFYDRNQGVWIPEKDGVVVKLLDTDSNGIVDALDSDGDDQPDDITNDGTFTDEVTGLDDHTKYTPNTTYWRVSIPHFSPCDINWAMELLGIDPNTGIPNETAQPSVEPDKDVCFVQGTLVKTGNGSIPIEKIKKGDLVLSQHENSDHTVIRKVSKTFVTPNQSVIELIFNNGNEILSATAEHPFRIKDRGWVAANKLKPGDKAHTKEGTWLTLTESRRSAEKQTVYNIEVEDANTYFVGKSGLWVHNACRESINPRKRTLDKDIDLPGTGMTLHYASDRVKGYKTHISVPVSGSSVNPLVKQMVAKVEIAGITMIQYLDPLPDQIAFFEWDGLDYLGRPVGSTPVKISVAFIYDSVYSFTRDTDTGFGFFGYSVTNVPTRGEMELWKHSAIIMARPKNHITENGLSHGWTLSTHHHLFPPDTSILHKGNGETIDSNISVISTAAGNGAAAFTGEGGSASETGINAPWSVTADAMGNIYITSYFMNRIFKVDTDSIITTFAGNGSAGYNGDGGLAVDTSLSSPNDTAVDSAGNIYIADTYNHRIRKVDTSGIITTVAGNGTDVYSGDSGAATDAGVPNPMRIAVDTAGNLYIASQGIHRIRRVDTGGTITTFAGNGSGVYSGDDGPAIDAGISTPRGIVADQEGNIYIAEYGSQRIRKVDVTGIITTFAGNGTFGYSGDGAPAIDATFRFPSYVAVDSTGNVYIADWYNHAIRRVDTSGIITTVAGNGNSGYSGDGGPATNANIYRPFGVAVDADYNIYIADKINMRIRKVTPDTLDNIYSTGQDIPFTSDPNGLGYIMGPAGSHKTTIDLDTGVTLSQFEYDTNNKLISVTDQFSNHAVIQRDINGVPTSFVSPDGVTTLLTVDGDNHLVGIIYPDGLFNTNHVRFGGDNLKLYFDTSTGLLEPIPWDVHIVRMPPEPGTIDFWNSHGTDEIQRSTLLNPETRLERNKMLWEWVSDGGEEIIDKYDDWHDEIRPLVWVDVLKAPTQVDRMDDHRSNFVYNVRRVHKVLSLSNANFNFRLEADDRAVMEAVSLNFSGIQLDGIELADPLFEGKYKLYEDVNENGELDELDLLVADAIAQDGQVRFDLDKFISPELKYGGDEIDGRYWEYFDTLAGRTRYFVTGKLAAEDRHPLEWTAPEIQVEASNAVTDEVMPSAMINYSESLPTGYIGITAYDASDVFDLDAPKMSQQAFLQAHPEFQVSTTMPGAVELNGDVTISGTIIVPENVPLILLPGTDVTMMPEASILSYGGLEAIGTPEQRIHIHGDDSGKPWGVVAVLRAPQPVVADYIDIEGGGQAQINSTLFSGGFAVHNTDLEISNCSVVDMSSEDGLNLKNGNVLIDKCLFARNASDAVDIDFGVGEVRNSHFVDNVNDGLDISGSTLLVKGLRFENNGDKGFSVGENSYPTVIDALFRGNNIGMAIKDLSHAQVAYATFVDNVIALEVKRKKAFFGGGSGEIVNSVFVGNQTLIDEDYFSDGQTEIRNSVADDQQACPTCVEGIAQFRAAAEGDYRLLPNMFSNGEFIAGTADWISPGGADEMPQQPGIYSELRK